MNKKILKKEYDRKRYLKSIKKGICVDCKGITQGFGKRCQQCGSKFNRHESRKDITE